MGHYVLSKFTSHKHNSFILYLGKTIGKGTFGKVKLGSHNLTGEKVNFNLVYELLGCSQNLRKRQNSRC